jgi:hypothetical protein
MDLFTLASPIPFFNTVNHLNLSLWTGTYLGTLRWWEIDDGQAPGEYQLILWYLPSTVIAMPDLFHPFQHILERRKILPGPFNVQAIDSHEFLVGRPEPRSA